MRYSPLPVSLVQLYCGLDTLPSVPRSAAVIPPLPLLERESFISDARSPKVLFHRPTLISWLVTAGFPGEKRTNEPDELREASAARRFTTAAIYRPHGAITASSTRLLI